MLPAPRSPLASLAALAALFAPLAAFAQTTISPTDRYAYGANIGWTDARPSATDGARVTENVCSGYLYAANVGWINLGDGTPANGIAYGNASGTDFGVNVGADGALRGYAYGANIGWINFENTGDPHIDLTTGRLSGYAYGANVGWINLGTFSLSVATLNIAPALDTDGDGIPDFWELANFGGLGVANGSTDKDGDGALDKDEYAADTNPNDPNDKLRIVTFDFNFVPSPDTAKVEFTSKPTRLYSFEFTSLLASPTVYTQSSLGWFLPDPGTTTTRTFTGSEGNKWFFKVSAKRPLAP